MPPYRGTPVNINIYLIFLKLESSTYILPLTLWVYLHSNFSDGLRSATVRIGRSMSSKVIHVGTDRKCVCDFLLVRRSNVGPILHRFRDIAGFCAYDLLFYPNFGGVLIGPDHPYWGQPEQKP